MEEVLASGEGDDAAVDEGVIAEVFLADDGFSGLFAFFEGEGFAVAAEDELADGAGGELPAGGLGEIVVGL